MRDRKEDWLLGDRTKLWIEGDGEEEDREKAINKAGGCCDAKFYCNGYRHSKARQSKGVTEKRHKQQKVLSMSRLGGAGAVAQLVADIPLQSSEGEASESGGNQLAWEKCSSDGTEQQVAKLMEEDVGAAMQFLQSKALCIMPISLASAIYHTHQTDPSAMIKPEPNAPSKTQRKHATATCLCPSILPAAQKSPPTFAYPVQLS